jgi:hypothetical protein
MTGGHGGPESPSPTQINTTPEQEYQALISWVSYKYVNKIQIVPGICEKELKELAEKFRIPEIRRCHP